jgi:hypothetical protein
VCFMVGQSDWLPMMIATGFPAIDPSKRPKKKRAIIGTVVGVARRRYDRVESGRFPDFRRKNKPIGVHGSRAGAGRG